MQTINLPSTITEFSNSTFKNCSALTTIKIDNNANNDLSKLGINDIPESCFEGCTKINNLKFSQNVTSPQKATFKDCTSLNSLTFGNNNVNDFTNTD